MHAQQQHVILLMQPHQPCPEQRPHRQVEVPDRLLPDAPAHLRLALRLL